MAVFLNETDPNQGMLMADEDTLCGWGDESKIAYFLANADIIVPRRAEQVALLTELLPYPSDARIAVLDLGAGYGAITEQVLEHYPRAFATCVDGSQGMVAHATERLRKYGERVKVLKADLTERSWPGIVKSAEGFSSAKNEREAPIFDAAVSAIAIHHLTHERKRELCREVFRLLAPGGIFLNNDLVATPPALKDRFEELNLVAIQQQERAHRGVARPLEQIQAEIHEQFRLAGGRHHSHIAPLSDQLTWLTEAGFESVDCYWRYLDLAIFGGVKEPEGPTSR
jgi:tRNA (cmo5U34)-methyltransferase